MTRMIAIILAAGMLSAALAQPVLSASLEEMWAKVRSFTVETKDAALDSGKQLVRETDAKIKELEGKADKSSGDAKAAYERSIKDLRQKREAAAAKLDEMGKASGSAWEATKQGFSDAYKDLQQSYDKAVDSNKK